MSKAKLTLGKGVDIILEKSKPEIFELSQSISTSQSLNSFEEKDGEVINIIKPLFKKTISRLVLTQMLNLFLEDPSYNKFLRFDIDDDIFSEMFDFIVVNNNYEWPYFRNKKLIKNFIKNLMLFINKNIDKISEIFHGCESVFKSNTLIKTLTYCAVGEYMMVSNLEEEKNYHSILLNEYVSISEYFLNSNEVKLFNGVIESLFKKINSKNQDNCENNL